jgi:hypothetical protein
MVTILITVFLLSVVTGKMKIACLFLVEKPEMVRPAGKLRQRGRILLKLILKN